LYRLTSEQIYAAADTALYLAKEAGRDRVEAEAHFQTGMHRRIKLQADLKSAESA
jgi:predicted signal transduction protein with EAL and GGDEF domain